MAFALLTAEQAGKETMIRIRVTIGILWVCCLLVGRAVWSSSLDVPALPTLDHQRTARPQRVAQPLSPRPDLNGNEVSAAFAEYEIDARGDLYELHSPETATPRLGQPTM